jgi:long-chain acyl-CoA synthetase
MAAPTIPARLFEQAKARPDHAAYFEKEGGAYRPTSYAAYASLVRRVGKALLSIGFGPGDTASILGKNRSEWVLLDVAAMCVGGAPAGIYTTSSPEEIKYIAGHAASKVVLVEDLAQWKKVEQILGELPAVVHVVLMRGAATPDHPKAIAWDAFVAKGDGVDDARFDERLRALEPHGLATLIYTSGTTGPPKAVMLSHENLAWTASAAQTMTGATPNERSLSYLPLSHIAEQVFTIHGPITNGSTVYFAESMEKLLENLREVEPTLFFGVPRVWEKFVTGVRTKLADAKGAKKFVAEQAMRVGAQVNDLANRGERPGALLAAQYRLATRLVFSKLKPGLGLGKARILVSGAAPIAPEVLQFLASLDLPVREVYGQSEDTGPTSFNLPGKTKFGTVGPRVPGVDVKIAADGEILVKGPNVFLGYLKEPAATAEVLIDGWLHSGDLGEFDADGYLKITGRKKEILITAGGKNISPKNIEGAIKNHPLVGEAVVIGDRRKYLTALVALDPEATARFVAEHAVSGAPESSSVVRAEIQKAIDDVNATLARVETVKKFVVLGAPLSIDKGELTPTLKVKRRVVEKNYAAEIEGMYAE